ncbi:hypothetical dipeptidyl aminopeptidase/ acylaminoacyl-peptidase related protein [Rhizocola hellebori]|uniref:Hypothetical dipeptidyl aminopeptidase/ acylaminoacyl-peptidase related protein n=1 Tax=Rhizocola hellebori TaxID=1392758 RepID=A0A8J3Q3B0_9ACTN|nr:alpha/beta fold hydrolase [Rhizocola hellebori]GIH02588.1 hypothetical dipeptidyl aminopeptidase/ acylaminoacyl-peptidase related protein [Rhizocola hellebori]
MALFADPVHDEFAGWALGFAPYGGGDIGEVRAIAGEVKPGDDDSFATAFSTMAQRRIDEGDSALALGHRETAHDCYLRASCFLGVAYHVLYGTPVDPRLVELFQLQMATFEKALMLLDPPAEKVDVPYEGTRIPAYFLRAAGDRGSRRPVVLVGGGWDSAMAENHLGFGAAALRRGYHVLLFDGPGQGKLLIEEGLPLRHDWEKVITAVIDAAVGIEGINPDRIAFYDWSLGGYLAPRAAAFEHRIAAMVADPGQIDVGGKFTGMLRMMGLNDQALAKLPELDADDEQRVMTIINSDRSLRWKIVQRGFWTNNATDMSSYMAEMAKWKLDADQVAAIRCPTLITAAESDLASSNAQELFDALKCPKYFIRFTDADGAGDHCEFFNRSMANRKILDWLDDTLAA